jgi:demethylmenaquinone methyltransferase/2-methoxy-6-polyprenyl-1,4-benzoquinol methylase
VRTSTSPAERSSFVRQMFADISGRYDLMNRLMTFGQDMAWRREVVSRVRLPPAGRFLDLGAGTGDLGLEVLRRDPRAQVVAADFTPEMIRVGRRRPGGQRIRWVAADAHHLPFAADTFDGLASGYLLRNVADVSATLAEQRRVLRSGKNALSLDTTPPARGVFLPFLKVYLHLLIPWLGRLVTGSRRAYNYLPDSTENFLRAEDLAQLWRAGGFAQVGFRRRMLGTMAIHWGVK